MQLKKRHNTGQQVYEKTFNITSHRDKVQIKTSMSYYPTLIRIVVNKNQNKSVEDHVEKLKLHAVQ